MTLNGRHGKIVGIGGFQVRYKESNKIEKDEHIKVCEYTPGEAWYCKYKAI